MKYSVDLSRFLLVVDGLRIVIIGLNRFFEPAHFLGHLVESILKHDALGDDEHHMGGDEHLALDGGVEPLMTTSGAAHESAVVNEDTSPELNSDVAKGKETREDQENIHLLAEKLLVEVVLFALPVLVAELAVVNRLILFLVRGIVSSLKIVAVDILSNAALLEEVVLLAGNDQVEDEVDDEEHGSPVKARRVDFGSGTGRAESRNEGHHEGEAVQDIHDAEVPLGALLDDLTRFAWHGGEDFIEAKEGEVVGGEDEDPIASDVLSGQVKCDQAAQLRIN